MKTALISVYNKEGIVEFAKGLVGLGFKLIASGGTAKALMDAGLEVTDVASLVGGGAILGHRVVTLSREIHAGLLARDIKEDRDELEKLNIPWIDLVCVDLYPLVEEINKPGSTKESVIEKTDIGGPTMLRSAAKGRRIVVCDPADRLKVVDWLKAGEPEKEKFIDGLVAKAEAVVADYALASARYHGNGCFDGMVGEQVLTCKYGENGWQTPAGLYEDKGLIVPDPLRLSAFTVVAGTTPSYNNLADIDRQLQTITHITAGFDVNYGKVPFVAVGVKHGNPCGTAVGEDAAEVIKKMLEGDLRAIFGGLVMMNFEITDELAEVLLTHKMPEGQRRLLDGIIAPAISPTAIAALKRKGDKCRMLVNPALANLSKDTLDIHPRFRYVRGGFLRQPNYAFVMDFKHPQMEIVGEVSQQQKTDMLLAWAVGSTSNSNTVTLVKDGMLLGNGVGQQDRVGGCELAVKRAKDAGHNIDEAAAYSDSFFPFTDGTEALAKAGISAILTTSGSVRDKDVKEFCQKQGVALAMIPDSVARGFFGH